MNSVEIQPLDEESYAFAVNLLSQQLNKHAMELGLIDEDPVSCYLHSLNKNSKDIYKKAASVEWADCARIDLSRLQYFVAKERKTGILLGVSGIYSVLPGYLARGGCPLPHVSRELERPDHFWMGWTAVVDEVKGRGIGTKLMKYGIGLARIIAGEEGITDPYWTVLADAGGVNFYKHRGLTVHVNHGSGVIFVDLLVDVLAKCNLPPLEGV